MRRSLPPNAFALGAVWLLATLFYMWTATSSGNPIQLGAIQHDFYNLQVDGYLDGELSVPVQPPAALLALSNPYDPNANTSLQAALHDLSLYHGRLYLSWGPTPAVTLFAPWRILQVGQLDQNLAVLIYASVGLAAALALLSFLLRRFALKPSSWKVTIAAIVLATGSVVPYLLRTPRVYEVAIAGGYCFSMLGLYLLVSGAFGERVRWPRCAVGSLCLGLAAGARWDLLLLGGLAIAIAVWVIRRDRISAGRSRLMLAALMVAPWAAMIALLLVYNAARFGDPLQFGSRYQLAGFDPTQVKYYQLGYIAPSLYYYVAAPVRLMLAFPFLALPPPPVYPGGVPDGYAPEIIGGVLTTTPLLLLLFIAPYLTRRRISRELAVMLAAAVIAGCALVGAIAFSVPGGTMRYEADFATLFMIPALAVWMAAAPAHRWQRRIVGVGGALLAVYGVIVGVAISITGEEDNLRLHNPETYQSLEQAASSIPTLAASIAGHAIVTRVILPNPPYGQDRGAYGTYDPAGQFYVVPDREEIDVVAPTSGRYHMSADFTVYPGGTTERGTIVNIADGHGTYSFPFTKGTHQVDVTLKTGLNRLTIWVSSTARMPPLVLPPAALVGRNLAFRII
jgi:hypothetical protein